MTLIQIIDRARDLLNEPLSTTRTFPDNSSGFWTDDALTGYVNMTQEEVQNEIVAVYEDYFTTSSFLNITSGCDTYTLPTGTIKIRRLEDTRVSDKQTVEIRPVTLNHKGEEVYDLLSGTFIGNNYYIVGGDIVLTETPTFTNASAIKMYYSVVLDELSGSGAISGIPEQFHNILVWGCVKNALFAQQSDTNKADIEYEKRLMKLRRHAEDRQVQRPRRVKRVYTREQGEPI